MQPNAYEQYETATIKGLRFSDRSSVEIFLRFDGGGQSFFVPLEDLSTLIKHVVGVPDVAPFLGAKVFVRRNSAGKIAAIGAFYEL